jgi:hypothetical protein
LGGLHRFVTAALSKSTTIMAFSQEARITALRHSQETPIHSVPRGGWTISSIFFTPPSLATRNSPEAKIA